MRDALRVALRVFDRDRTAHREREQREALETALVDDRLEIGNVRIERERRRRPVRESAAAQIETHEPPPGGQVLEPVPPHRALPLELEMRKPVRRLDDRRAGAALGVRDAYAVGALR